MKIQKFPSPVGELHFSIRTGFSVDDSVNKLFPSPVGELHFSMVSICLKKKKESLNFRPLSGNYISQL